MDQVKMLASMLPKFPSVLAGWLEKCVQEKPNRTKHAISLHLSAPGAKYFTAATEYVARFSRQRRSNQNVLRTVCRQEHLPAEVEGECVDQNQESTSTANTSPLIYTSTAINSHKQQIMTLLLRTFSQLGWAGFNVPPNTL